MKEFLKKNHQWLAGGILTLFAAISLLNAWNDSATFDEIAHIPAGYSYLTRHDTRLNPEHPPLIKDLAAIPLLFLNLKFDTTQAFWTGTLPKMWDEGQWAAGRHLLYEAGNNPDLIVFWARVPMVLLAVFFGWFLYRWGKEIGGALAGLFILALYAFDPNILGHNHFLTTDIGIAAFLTFAFYYFLKFIKDPTWKNTALGGFFLGLLLVSKFSSIVAAPIFGLTLVIYGLVSHGHQIDTGTWKGRLQHLGEYLGKGVVALALAMLVVWVVYFINTYEMPKETLTKTINWFFPVDDTNFKSTYTNRVLTALNQSELTRPWSAYFFGPAWVFKRVAGGNGAYFMGQVGNGFAWYFPVVFLIKETIPFLLLIIFSLGFTLQQTVHGWFLARFRGKELWGRLIHFLRSSVMEYTVFLFIIMYAFLSIKGSLNIGFRHLFPILPFAYLLVTKKTFEFLKKTNYKTSHAFGIVILVLLAWQITTTALAYPHYTSYFNETVGGPSQGYQLVTDSNADWGQDLKRLKIYLDQHPEIQKIHVNYFGGGRPELVLGSKFVEWWDSKRPIEPGWYAISVNYSQGSIYDSKKTNADSYRWLRNYPPVAQVGTSILIYYVPEAPQ